MTSLALRHHEETGIGNQIKGKVWGRGTKKRRTQLRQDPMRKDLAVVVYLIGIYQTGLVPRKSMDLHSGQSGVDDG